MLISAAALAALVLGVAKIWMGDLLQWMASASQDLLETSLRVENAMWLSEGLLSATMIDNLFSILYDVACGLLILKFLWKGFEIYVLWRDGDSDVSPHNLLVGVIMAIVVCAAFPSVYDIAVDTTLYVGNAVLEQIGDAGLLPFMSEEQLNEAADNKLNSFWSVQNGAAALVIDDWFDLLDDNHDGWIAENEVLCVYDMSGDGWLEANELQAYLRNVWGITPPREVLDERQRGPDAITHYYKFSRDTESEGTHPLAMPLDTYREWFVKKYSWDFTQRVDKMSFVETLVVIIYAIAFFIMWLRLLGRGLEMLIIRVGLPIAAVGLIDSDGGVFKNYTQLILRQMVTGVFQVAAMRLSIMLMLDLSFFGVCAGVAALLAAFRAPLLLQQIMTPQKAGGQGFGSKLYQGVMIWRMLKH